MERITYQYRKLPSLQFALERILKGLKLDEAFPSARGLVLPPQRMRTRYIKLTREQKLNRSRPRYASDASFT